jgi:uncharacterized membrane protein
MQQGEIVQVRRNASLLNGLYWITLLHLVFFEGVTGVTGFLGFLTVGEPNTVFMLILQAMAFFVSLVVWIVLVTCLSKAYSAPVIKSIEPGVGVQTEIASRGSSIFRSAGIYFFVTMLIHASLLAAWIVWQAKFGDLSPLSFSANFGPLVVAMLIYLAQFIMLFVALFFFVYDIRNHSATLTLQSMARFSNKLASVSANIDASSRSSQ